MRRRLGICAVAVTVCAAVALFARAQSGAPEGAIVVTGQAYAPWSASRTAGNVFTVVDYAQSRSIAAATPTAGAFLSRADMPNQVIQETPGESPTHETKQALTFWKSLAGNGKVGFLGDGGNAANAELNLSQDSLVKRSGIAVAEDGTLYIADTKNSTIRVVAGAKSSEPGIIRSLAGKWAPAQNVRLVEPMGVAVDRAGNLYIADHTAGTVSMLRQATGQLTILAHVASPASLTVTRDGSKVFVASPETGGVFAIKTLDNSITAVAGFAPAADAQANAGLCAALESSAAAAVKATGICPAGIAADGRGNLFVADANSGRILRVDAASGKTSTAVVGLITPGDIAFDAQGDLFVSEQKRSRILAMAQIGDASGNLRVTTPTPPACPQGASFTYCNEPSGGSSPSFQFTLQNLSANAISGISITPAFVPVGTNPPPAPTNFTTTSTACTSTLAAGASCVINVAFTPLTAGSITGQLIVSDANPSDTVTVNLAGTGDDFSLVMASGNSPEVTVAQGDTATFKLQLNADSVFGANGEKVTLACPAIMPSFTTCEFQPCPVTPTVGGATAFNLLVHTSTKTVETPPISNPCNSTTPAARTRHADAPGGILYVTMEPPANGGGRFPALALILGALILVGFGVVSARSAATPRLRRAFAALVLVVIASGIVAACHKNSNAISTATPLGTTTLTFTASAVDSSGNSLSATRGSPQLTLDVIKQAPKKP